MSRESENALLLLTGLALAMITATGAFSRYVKTSLQPWLYVTAAVVIGLALVAIIGDIKRDAAPHHHDEHSHASRAVWLLFVPVVVLIVVTPPALRPQASVPRISAVSNEALRRPFPPLPPGRAPEVTVPNVVIRAAQDSAGTLDGRLITVIGFTLRDGEAVDLGRFSVLCCAADARLARVRLEGSAVADAARLPEHTWVRVEGTVRAAHDSGQPPAIPSVDVNSVTQIDVPADVYA